MTSPASIPATMARSAVWEGSNSMPISGFCCGPKKARPASWPKFGRNDHGHDCASLAHGHARIVGRRGLHIERLFLRQPFDDFVRNRAVVLVHCQDGNLALVGLVARASQNVTEKGSDGDGNSKAHQQRTAVHEEQQKVFADQGAKRDHTERAHHIERDRHPGRIIRNRASSFQ